ncbi:TPA_asm: M [Primula alphacytorhabdovirus 2]|nr:TPA_asm: M [Primula alphacytorhabdovirus 2]
MSKFWICAAVYAKHSELELSNKTRLKDFDNNSLIHGYCDLLSHLGKAEVEATSVLLGLIKNKRYAAVTDVATSAFFGPKTMRIKYIPAKMNVFPVDTKLKEGKVSLRADGLTTIINKVKVRANVNIDIVISSIPPDDIDTLLGEKPSWFCGELGIEGGLNAPVVLTK